MIQPPKTVYFIHTQKKLHNFYNKNHGANVSKSFNCQGKLTARVDKQKGQETDKLLPSTSQLCKSSAQKKKREKISQNIYRS